MDGKYRRYAMTPAFGMVIYPRILVLGMFQAAVAFLAWISHDVMILYAKRTRRTSSLARFSPKIKHSRVLTEHSRALTEHSGWSRGSAYRVRPRHSGARQPPGSGARQAPGRGVAEPREAYIIIIMYDRQCLSLPGGSSAALPSR